MNKLLLACLSLVVLTTPSFSRAENTFKKLKRVYLVKNYEDLRHSPSLDSKTIDFVKADDDALFLLKRSEAWVHVRVYHRNYTVNEGWILENKVKTAPRLRILTKFLGLRNEPSHDSKTIGFVSPDSEFSLFLLGETMPWKHVEVYQNGEYWRDFWVQARDVQEPEPIEDKYAVERPQDADRKYAEAQATRQKKIEELESKLKTIPESDYAAKLAIYNNLLQVDPGNTKYSDKRDFYFNKEYERKKQEAERKKQEAKIRAEKKRKEMAEKGYVLELLTWHWDSRHGYVTAEGQIRNISGTKLRNVQALVTWYDEKGTMIASDSSLVEYDPIMPGQVSPFKVMERHNPMMHNATIEFKFLRGSKIPTYNTND